MSMRARNTSARQSTRRLPPGYDYHGPNALWRPSTHVAPNTLGRHFRQFNREQQADIAADYYYSLYHNAAA
jgi:hypothetical protein